MTVLKHANIEVSERSSYSYYVQFKEWKGTDLGFTVWCASEELEKNYAASTHCCAGNLLPTPCASLRTSGRLEPDPEGWQWPADGSSRVNETSLKGRRKFYRTAAP